MTGKFSLMVHGGAGAGTEFGSEKLADEFMESIHVVLKEGRSILERGGSALDTVEQCAAMLEDDTLFNAGTGSVLNEAGRVEMDAAIMDGQGLRAGAVAGVTQIANPARLARVVLEKSEHVMLAGEGAHQFAVLHGIALVPNERFITPGRKVKWEALKQAGQHEGKYGTIGAVARDPRGNLAAVTSTGGISHKRFGRIGDSPIIGAGVYADNATCAISCTGHGEGFIRTALAKTVSHLIEFRAMDAATAVKHGIEYLENKVNGCGGVIVIDHAGRCASGYNTEKMLCGWIEAGGEANIGF